MAHGAFSRTLLVVEDHALTLALLCDALRRAGFTVVGVRTPAEALARFDDVDPDVLLTDINLGVPISGVDLAVALKSRAPYLAMVLLSNYATDSDNPAGFQLPPGAAYLAKSDLDSTEALLEVIEAVLRDESAPDLASHPDNPLSGLTRKQLRILQRMAQGWSNNAIARHENVSGAALEKLITRTFVKLGLYPSRQVNSRVLAVRLYYQSVGIPPAALPWQGDGDDPS